MATGAGQPCAAEDRGSKYDKYPPPIAQEEQRPSSSQVDSSAAAAQPESPGFLARLAGRSRTLSKVNLPLFFYLNFLCRNVRRLQRGKYIFPYRGTRLRLAKTARINVGGHIFLNSGKHPHSRQECMVSLEDGAVWDANGVFRLNYGTFLILNKDARLVTGDNVAANTGTVIACNKKLAIGNYVMIGWNVTIFDSDFHPRYGSGGKRANADRETVIEDNVWIATKSTILKGTHIGTGAVIAAGSLVSGFVPPRSLVASAPSRPVLRDIGWER